MPEFKITHNGKDYFVDAPDEQTANEAMGIEFGNTYKQRKIKNEQKIESRGQFPIQRGFDMMKQPGIIPKMLGGLQVVGGYGQQEEAAMANPLLSVQDPSIQANKLPQEAMQQFIAGAKGERLGEVGDVLRRAGAPEPVAIAGGAIASSGVPYMAIKRGIGQITKNILKFGDKGLLKQGNRLIQAADSGVAKMADDVAKAYKPLNNIVVPKETVSNIFENMPSNLIKHIEETVGSSVDDIMENVNIETMRKIKGAIGEVKPSAFGKEARGAAELITDKKVNKAYAKAAEAIRTAAKESAETPAEVKAIEKALKELEKADNAFYETKNASNVIKSAVVDPKGKKATRAGKVAEGLKKEADVTVRDSLVTIRRASTAAEKNIDKAVEALHSFNKWMATTRFLGRVAQGVGYAGIVGMTAGSTVARSRNAGGVI